MALSQLLSIWKWQSKMRELQERALHTKKS